MMKDTIKLFVKEIQKSFDEFLKEHGFSCTKSDAGESDFYVVYRNEERYILIGGMLKPNDYPYYFYVSLGEGSDKMPEADWNAVALWRIMQSVSPEHYEKYLLIFEILAGIKEDEIIDKIWTSRELCKECAKEFLSGDLTLFRSIRAELNRDREPYKIYVLDSDGQHKITYEEESVKFKNMFS